MSALLIADISPTVSGLGLLGIGLVLLITEAHVPSAGFFAIAGGACLVFGGIVLYEGDSAVVDVAAAAMIATGVFGAAFAIYAGRRTLEVHRTQAKTGWEELVGRTADVRQPLDPVGQVFVEGALWRARAEDDARIAEGNVRVQRVDGLTLIVTPSEKV